LKAELEKAFPGIDVELIESGGGVFEVTHENDLVFSKKALGRFPDTNEVVGLLS
jgi:selenoprotein W-related protein